jgi:transcriptional regulator with GAF, ATPase, and Fis domain
MAAMTGFVASEVMGQPCGILQGDTCLRGPVAQGPERCPLFAKQDVIGKRCTLRRKDGSVLPVHKNARLMLSPAGDVLGGIEVVTDISGVIDLEAELSRLRTQSVERARVGRLIGADPSMQRLYDMIDMASRNDLSVLIEGETGTGKELVAHAIHHMSQRRDRPFIRVSCAALSEALLESELFGHVRGAFTGAFQNRQGRFEAANGGTLLLDEIGDVSLNVQTKLLRVIQEHEFERVGDSRPIRVDIRVIAATNVDLVALCEQGRFRRDLYYRLAVVPIATPPLREHKPDIPMLVEHFERRMHKTMGRPPRGVTPAALDVLTRYDWPGNVRELEHAVEYASAVARDRAIDTDALPPTVNRPALPPLGASPPTLADAPRTALTPARIAQALAQTGGNRARAAEILGTSRVTLWKWMKRFDLT